MKNYKKGNDFNRKINRTSGRARSISIIMIIQIWISNPFSLIGLVFTLFSIPFVWVFSASLLSSSPSFDENDPVVKAKISNAIGTNSYINDIRVYEYIYTYEPTEGGSYEGSGYVTGYEYEVGDDVDVRYKKKQPELSLALGMRADAFGAWIGLLVLIFPLVGILMLFFGSKKAVNSVIILKYGEVAKGKFISKESTNVEINDETVYKLKFEFTAKDGQKYTTYAKTHKTHVLEDDEFEKLVYDKDEPENTVLLDTLPKYVRKYIEQEF